MTTDFATEPKLPLSALIKVHPSLLSVSPRTLLRWAQRARRGVLLESVLVGGRVMSSLNAVDRYLATLNAGATPTAGPGSAPRSPTERSRASLDAARELEQAGA